MILYIGNMLSKHGYAPTSVETIGSWLAELYPVKRVSSYKTQWIRLAHIIFTVFRFRKRCKLILIDTYSGKAFMYALVAGYLAQCFDIRYILILRGGDLPKRFNKNPRISKWLITKAYNTVTPSAYLQSEVTTRGWGTPLCIPNTIELNNYTFRERYSISPRLLWVRSFHSIYNPMMALEVLQELKKQGYKEAKLCMIGQDKDGSMIKFKNKVIEYGLIDNVEITGRLEKSVWIKKSEEYDIFMNTTNVDNTPVSVIEAMALGLPVVSTNVGGIPFLLSNGKDAMLVEKGDVMQMTSKIVQLISSKELALRIAINARKKTEGFSWEYIKPKWIKLIEKVL